MKVSWLFAWAWLLPLSSLPSHASTADLPKVPSVLWFSCGAVLILDLPPHPYLYYHLWASSVTLPALVCSPPRPPFPGLCMLSSLLPTLFPSHPSPGCFTHVGPYPQAETCAALLPTLSQSQMPTELHATLQPFCTPHFEPPPPPLLASLSPHLHDISLAVPTWAAPMTCSAQFMSCLLFLPLG